MLEFFRQHIGGMFGLGLVGLLALAFALSFGGQSQGWGKAQTEEFAATVNGTDIPESTLKYAFNLSGGRNLDQDSAERSAHMHSVLNGLIERQLLIDLANDFSISASIKAAEERIVKNEIYLTLSITDLAKRLESNMFLDPSLFARILTSDGHRVRQSFKDSNGKFDLETYQKFVRYHLQITEQGFVEQQRFELIAEQMRQLITSSVRVSEDEIRAAYDREHDTAKIAYIRLIPSYFADRLDPSEAELEGWAATHPDEIKQYYETNKFKYTNLEKMARARHILIKVAEDAPEEERKTARDEIDQLLIRTRSGEDFSALARQYSEDPGSAAKGGDLGFNPRGRMVPEFDEAMFRAEPGSITDIVPTKYGFHIIRVEEFREGNITLEEATAEIAEILFRRTKGEETAKTKAGEFLAQLKGGTKMADLIPQPEEDERPEERLGLKILTSREFTRSATSIPGIGQAPEIVQAAFKLTLDDSIPEKAFELRGDHFVVRLAERKNPSDEEFAKLKGDIAGSLLSTKQAAWLRDRLVEMKVSAEKEGRIAVYYTPAGGATPPRRQGPSGDTPLGPEGKPDPGKKADSKKESKPKEGSDDKPVGNKPVKAPAASAPAPDEDEQEAE